MAFPLLRRLLVATCLLGLASAITLPDILSDGMVIPRDRPVTIWGWAQPGEKIEVFFLLQRATAVAGPDGKFVARYPKGFGLTGGPFLLVIQGAGRPVVIHEVMVGDLWHAMGNAVAGDRLSQTPQGASEISNAHHMRLRFFLPVRQTAGEGATNLRGSWVEAHPTNASNLPALAYLAAKEVYKKTFLPQGVVDLTWPGAPAEAWVGELSLRTNDRFDRLFTRTKYYLPFETNHPGFKERTRQLRDLQKLWEMQVTEWIHPETNLDVLRIRAGVMGKGPWNNFKVPGVWEDRGFRLDGVVWCRRWVVIPSTLSNQSLTVHLGRISTWDMAFWNGVPIGTNWGPGITAFTPRRYEIPAGALKPGSNLLAVRIYDVTPQAKGGFLSPDAELKITAPTGAILPLAGTWQMATESVVDTQKYPPRPEIGRPFQICSSIYHGMVKPVADLAPTGVWWESGEANAPRAAQFRDLFPAVVRDIRVATASPELPFYHLQNPGARSFRGNPGESDLAELREAQGRLSAQKKNTFMVTTADLWVGSNQVSGGTYPKDLVARRLANWILANQFRQRLVTASPVFRSLKVDGDKIRVDFSGVGDGLVLRNPPDLPATNEILGFAVAGADKRYFWAQARLVDKDTVQVWATNVAKPVSLRYGWADRPWINLYSSAGLPVTPFRTDEFPLITEGWE